MIVHSIGSQLSFTIILDGCNWVIDRIQYGINDDWILIPHRYNQYNPNARLENFNKTERAIINALELYNGTEFKDNMPCKEFLLKVLNDQANSDSDVG